MRNILYYCHLAELAMVLHKLGGTSITTRLVYCSTLVCVMHDHVLHITFHSNYSTKVGNCLTEFRGNDMVLLREVSQHSTMHVHYVASKGWGYEAAHDWPHFSTISTHT